MDSGKQASDNFLGRLSDRASWNIKRFGIALQMASHSGSIERWCAYLLVLEGVGGIMIWRSLVSMGDQWDYEASVQDEMNTEECYNCDNNAPMDRKYCWYETYPPCGEPREGYIGICAVYITDLASALAKNYSCAAGCNDYCESATNANYVSLYSFGLVVALVALVGLATIACNNVGQPSERSQLIKTKLLEALGPLPSLCGSTLFIEANKAESLNAARLLDGGEVEEKAQGFTTPNNTDV